jgi:hypothetical protein
MLATAGEVGWLHRRLAVERIAPPGGALFFLATLVRPLLSRLEVAAAEIRDIDT